MKLVGQHAIVIGSGMGGLLAARVLSDCFTQVTILERDEFLTADDPRKGVPQGHHAHGLLATGWRILQRLFPGLERELLEAGALVGDSTRDGLWFQQGGYLKQTKGDLPVVCLSRPLLEAKIRARLLGLGNVQIVTGTDVSGLVSSEQQRVIGVRIARGADHQLLDADLVLDASGRGSRSSAWLEALGYAKPEISEIKINVGYASRVYRRASSDLAGNTHLIIAAKAPQFKRGGVLLAREQGCWMATLIGMLGDHCPSDEAGFLEFAKSLPTRDLYEVIANAEPLSGITSFRYPSSLRRHYERLKRFPEGFVVFADALCSFNPIFGQGMTVAALEAEALEASLAGGLEGLWSRFIRHTTKIVDIPWTLAASADLAYPEVPGKRGLGIKLINAYIPRLLEKAWSDPSLVVAFHQVSNLIKPPSSLFTPKIVWRVLRGNKPTAPFLGPYHTRAT
jgi:2-polyprenyl-6-methoxyphenol hydroxylase-like FAD-dependent oxidoreductase